MLDRADTGGELVSHNQANLGLEVLYCFGHQGFESRTRALRARLELRGAAENVSRHTRRRSQVPRAAVENWLKSRGHRRNIEGRYGTTGVGAARDPDGTWYLTQIFVAP